MHDHEDARMFGAGKPGRIRAPSMVVLDGVSGGPPADGLIIAVPLTTARETRTALSLVSSLITELNAFVVIVVPMVVPWELPLSRPGIATEAWRRRMIRHLSLPDRQIQFLRVLCRDAHSTWELILPRYDVIVCGCSPDSPLGKLAAGWRDHGVNVVFVPERHSGWKTRFATLLHRLVRFTHGGRDEESTD